VEDSCLLGVARMSLIVRSALDVAVGGRLKVWRIQALCVFDWENTQAWRCGIMPASSVSRTNNVVSTVSKLKSCNSVSLLGDCDVENVLCTRSATKADKTGRVRGIKDASPMAVRLCFEGLSLK
jgi:hypothetical protein